MNNSQFRKILLDTPARQNASSSEGRPSATPSAFGTKKSSFMPMTPRTVKGGIDVDFARQVRERNAALQPSKKFKSYTPKGVKYAAGYTDRAKAREETEDDEADSKAARIKALEEQMKLGQIPLETFEALRDQITGGDVSATHLVKGLDRQLLERVRRGEDVLGVSGDGDKSAGAGPDVEEELDKLGEKEVEAVKREKAEKKGVMAPPPTVAGKKRTRDEIMAEIKAQRQAAAEAKKTAALDGRWRKVGTKEESRIEIDHKGREVLITVDEDGVVKKKVRKAPSASAETQAAKPAAEMPDATKNVLGADVAIPTLAPRPATTEPEEDDDIFEGVGAEYNPLANDEDDEDEDSSDDDTVGAAKKLAEPPQEPPKPSADEESSDGNEDVATRAIEAPQRPPDAVEPTDGANAPASLNDVVARGDRPARRNYFNDTSSTVQEDKGDRFAGIENVLKKAAKLDNPEALQDDEREGETDEAREARLKKRAQMLANQDRDLEDMDMGFGSSRFEDDADGEGKKIRLAEWKGGEDGWEEDGKGESGKKKRKPKKRKGDVNSAADIMRVIEGRKAAK